jgi:hypothetical protein
MQFRVYLIILRAVVLLQPAAACAMGDDKLPFEFHDRLFRARVSASAPGYPQSYVAGPRPLFRIV